MSNDAEGGSAADTMDVMEAVRHAAAVRIQCSVRRMLARRELEKRKVASVRYGPQNVSSSTKTVQKPSMTRRVTESPRGSSKKPQMANLRSTTRVRSRTQKPELT